MFGFFLVDIFTFFLLEKGHLDFQFHIHMNFSLSMQMIPESLLFIGIFWRLNITSIGWNIGKLLLEEKSQQFIGKEKGCGNGSMGQLKQTIFGFLRWLLVNLI